MNLNPQSFFIILFILLLTTAGFFIYNADTTLSGSPSTVGQMNVPEPSDTDSSDCERLSWEECYQYIYCEPQIYFSEPPGDTSPIFGGCEPKKPSQLAKDLGDYTICQQEDKTRSRWLCYVNVAKVIKSREPCLHIKDVEMNYKCDHELDGIIGIEIHGQTYIRTNGTASDSGEIYSGKKVDIREGLAIYIVNGQVHSLQAQDAHHSTFIYWVWKQKS